MNPIQTSPPLVPDTPLAPPNEPREQPDQTYEEDIPSDDDQPEEADGKSVKPSGG